MTVRYSLDVDGVVANYRKGIRELAQHLGVRPQTQPVGLAPQVLDALMEERQEAARRLLGDWVTAHPEEFWSSLDSLARPDDLRAIRTAAAQGHELFWVSSRPSLGRAAKVVADLTLTWLQEHDLPADTAHVLLTPNKAQVLQAQNIRFHLDDLVPHATQIAFNSTTRVYLLKQPWNRHIIVQHPDEAGYSVEAAAFGIPEVESIAEYITLVMGQ